MIESDLFPSQEFRQRIDDALTVALTEASDRVVHDSVVPTFDVVRFRDELAGFDFKRPLPLTETLAWTIEQMERGLVHVTHPRYFGLFNPTPTFPAQCADRIVAAFNPQLATSTTSPAAVEIEAHVIRAVVSRIGFPSTARGHFTTGGSEANYTALILALTQACTGFATEGARAFGGPPVFYVSRESHLAWFKIAHQAGIGRSAVRLVATDGSGRLSLAALEDAIRSDCAQGFVPFMVVATAGTTNAGMIDPLSGCIGIARQYNLWCHVDAAWGGGLIASAEMRGRLSGIELADSVTIDAHKWFATTMGCGMFIARSPALLSTAFNASTTYMPSNIADVDPYVTSAQWSRRFVGLRLFLSLAVAGWDGFGRHVERSMALLSLLRRQLAAHGWQTLHESVAGVLCIVPPRSISARSIVDHVLASGKAWVSVAVTEGREVIRACVTSGLTAPQDISDLAIALLRAERTIHQGAILVDEMTSGYKPVIEEICALDWAALDQAQLSAVAWAYYFFSIQFRENLEIAHGMHADDEQLQHLVREECATDNLSPWPGVAAPGEKLDHDEFMRRLLRLSPIDSDLKFTIETAGQEYLTKTRKVDDYVRAISIASYEAGGLEAVFRSFLVAPHWNTPLLAAFRHFLVSHINFDSDPDHGHGALVQHLAPDDRIRCLWVEFRDLLITAVPRLAM
jgi:glutamate/tyrosine decarboxylase-like PLP-dependent enzyme